MPIWLSWLYMYVFQYMGGAHYRGISLQELRHYQMFLVGRELQGEELRKNSFSGIFKLMLPRSDILLLITMSISGICTWTCMNILVCAPTLNRSLMNDTSGIYIHKVFQRNMLFFLLWAYFQHFRDCHLADNEHIFSEIHQGSPVFREYEICSFLKPSIFDFLLSAC